MSVHHLAFRTRDVAALAAFYREVFDLEVVRAALPRSLWLGLANDAVLMIELRADDEPPVPLGTGELVALRADDDGRRRIRQRAVERDCFDGETDFTVYLRDPDGRRLGVSTYRFDLG